VISFSDRLDGQHPLEVHAIVSDASAPGVFFRSAWHKPAFT
jgi:hypothetical protein